MHRRTNEKKDASQRESTESYPVNALRKQISAFETSHLSLDSNGDVVETIEDSSGGEEARNKRKDVVKKFRKNKLKHGNSVFETEKSYAEIAYLAKQVRMDLIASEGLPPAPEYQEQFGVVFFVDVSGFTALGKQLRTDFTTQTATELLAQAIFGALETLTEICLKWGGDVAKFAGDALLCTWRVDDMIPGASPSVEVALRQARRAAFDMMCTLATEAFKDLDIHGGIGAGDYLSIHLEEGNKNPAETSRWHLITGKACLIANQLLEQSQKGEILFHDDFTNPEAANIECITKDTQIVKDPRFMQDAESFETPLTISAWSEILDLESVRVYVPRGLRNKLHGGGLEGGEVHQRISVMFVGADYLQMTEEELLENSLDKRNLIHLNNVYKSFTRIVHEYGGEMRDLLYDDKGCVFIAVFGAHNVIELPELKCMRAATKIASTHKRVKIGVDVGNCFTGMCGTKDRHDFVVMGHEVNMASKFMNGAEIGQVVASPKIRKSTQDFIEYKKHLMPIYKNKPVTKEDGVVYLEQYKEADYECYIAENKFVERAPSFIVHFRATQYGSTASFDSAYSGKIDKSFVGREKEMNEVLDFFGAVNHDEMRGIITISGVEGIGKSSFVKQIRKSIGSVDFSALGAGFSLEENTPYFVVRQILSELLGFERGHDEDNQQKVVAKLKQIGIRYDAGAMSHLFPETKKKPRESIVRMQSLLKKSIDRSDLAVDDPLDRQLRSVTRRQARTVKKVVKGIIAQHQKESDKGCMIVVEDLHWIDIHSLELFEEICQQEFPSVTFLFTFRPLREIPEGKRVELEQFLTNIEIVESRIDLTIRPLAESESNTLVKNILEAESHTEKGLRRSVKVDDTQVDPSVTSLVYERTNGHPNHVVILVKWLVESNNVRFYQSSNTFNFPNQASVDQSRLKLPASLREVILSRLDFLTDGDTRRILKVASVVGLQFHEGLLLKVLKKDGLKITHDELRASLEGLADLGFVVLGNNVDNDIEESGRNRSESFTSVKNGATPKLKNRVRRYLNPNTEEWSFNAEVIQQAIVSLIPAKRKAEIEAIIQKKTRSRMPVRRRRARSKLPAKKSLANLSRFFG